MGDDVKPEVINITIKCPDGDVSFKIKKTTRMAKVFQAFAQKKAVDENHYRYVFDGQRVGNDVTADQIGLEDGDTIDAFAQQDQEGGRVQFQIKKSTKLGKVFSAYAAKKAIDLKIYRFLFEGNLLNDDITAEAAEIGDGDTIEAVTEQLGGGAQRR